jgi:hypothetical protein
MVDHELGREERVDLLRIASHAADRPPHRREVDDRGNAREVLEEDARRREGDLGGGLRARLPPGQR